jgi:RNase_H superfamily
VARTVILDVEMRPALAWIWDLRTKYVSPQQVKEPKRLLCCAWKELGESEVMFCSEWDDGRDGMARILHGVLDSADIVVGHNSARFDVPVILTEIMLAGLDPPSPFQQVDTLKAARKFSFMSNRLGEVAKMLDTTRKLDNSGFDLWVRVMDGDEEARAEMESYNRGDVEATEALFLRLRPWLTTAPNVALLSGIGKCPACGSDDLRPRGYAATRLSRFRRYCCGSCGHWCRGTRRIEGADISSIAA